MQDLAVGSTADVELFPAHQGTPCGYHAQCHGRPGVQQQQQDMKLLSGFQATRVRNGRPQQVIVSSGSVMLALTPRDAREKICRVFRSVCQTASWLRESGQAYTLAGNAP